MPNIYDGELIDVHDEVMERLPGLARTSGHAFATIGNGHAAWQMAVCNTLSAGDSILVLECGRFATIWGALAEKSGVKVEVIEAPYGHAVDPTLVHDRLAADTDHRIKAVLMVQIDTASSVENDLPAIRAAIDAADHPALMMVDCIASLGCVPYEMDEWGIDITVGATQKGLMVPPGMSFVWASDKAIDAYATAGLRVGYFDWAPRMEEAPIYSRYSGTPPVTHLYGLRESLRMIDEEGLDNVWARHRHLASAVRSAVDAWATDDGIGFYVAEPSRRGDSVTTVATGSIDADELRRRCQVEAGLTIGIGVYTQPEHSFRIGHMGHTNPPVVLGTLGTIEAALAAMGAPIASSGVAAAAATIATAM